jgi:dihydropteroate synthase
MHWQTAHGPIDLDAPRFLGILNLTPDSFSDGGRHDTPAAALVQARQLLDQGAAVLDLGAESTRPGAAPVTAAEEWERLRPVLELLRTELPEIPLSLDTRHASVAEKGLACGAGILNDVTGFQDPDLLALARSGACGLIAMRSRIADGRLLMPDYQGAGHATAEAAIAELDQVKRRLLEAGIAPERILLDPGFGFGTTFREDLALWEMLPGLPARLDWPAPRFCIGISRKRFVAARAGTPALPPAQRDALTRTAHGEAIAMGYRVFRTHAI